MWCVIGASFILLHVAASFIEGPAPLYLLGSFVATTYECQQL